MANSRRLFLHRIGKEFGIIDIDLLDDAITDDMLMEFRAAAWIDGWYNGRTCSAGIIAEIRNLGSRMVVMNSANPKATTKQMSWVSGFDIIEQQTAIKKKKSKTMMTPEQFQKHLEKTYGG